MCGGDVSKRDHRLNYLVCKQCQSAGVRPELEKSKVLNGSRTQSALGRRRPADTFLHSAADVQTASKRQWLNVALDVGVINAQGSTHVSSCVHCCLRHVKSGRGIL